MEKSVRGFDVTASSPKSVSVLWAVGDDHVRAEVLAAHDAAVAALAGWIEAHAHTRFRMGGEVVVVDAEGIVAAGFRQHTSRALDPQLHTHLVVANRVKSPDGRWLAFDARTLKRDQRTLSALFHAAERAELTRRLGVAWGPVVNGIAEIEGIDRRVIEEFSTRTVAVTARLGEKLDRFKQTMGREPTPRERWQLEREAAVDSRPAKDHAVNADVLHERWVGQLRDLGIDAGRLVVGVIGRSLESQVDCRAGHLVRRLDRRPTRADRPERVGCRRARPRRPRRGSRQRRSRDG
jgi:conjugative relaxase-like TrwC/TraI family protein